MPVLARASRRSEPPLLLADSGLRDMRQQVDSQQSSVLL